MEDHLVKTARRHILVTLAWVGLLAGHRAWPLIFGQRPLRRRMVEPPRCARHNRRINHRHGDDRCQLITPALTSVQGEVIPPGERANLGTLESMPDFGQSLVGEHQMPIGSMSIFGDGAVPACEFAAAATACRPTGRL